MCQQNNNTKSRKGKHLNYIERQSINGNNKINRKNICHISK